MYYDAVSGEDYLIEVEEHNVRKEEIIRYKPTMAFRWFTPKRTDVEWVSSKLQQKWITEDGFKCKWRDIPAVHEEQS